MGLQFTAPSKTTRAGTVPGRNQTTGDYHFKGGEFDGVKGKLLTPQNTLTKAFPAKAADEEWGNWKGQKNMTEFKNYSSGHVHTYDLKAEEQDIVGGLCRAVFFNEPACITFRSTHSVEANLEERTCHASRSVQSSLLKLT